MFIDFTVQMFTAANLVDVIPQENVLSLILEKLFSVLSKAMIDRYRKPNEAKTDKKAEKARGTKRKLPKTEDPVPTAPVPPPPTFNPIPLYSRALHNRHAAVYNRLYFPLSTDLGYHFVLVLESPYIIFE